jgi:phosphatidylglycerol:prolipoprotein diacylglycerol transferase
VIEALFVNSTWNWAALGISPVAFSIGGFPIRWYSLSFLATFVLGRWYLRRLLREPDAPMQPDQADDLLLYVVLGVIVGGRLGFAAFYDQSLLSEPLQLAKLWNGGMSFHGGLIGLLISLFVFSRKFQVPLLRLLDYVGCACPFGTILVRIANFANGELWGRPTDLPWGMIFPQAGDNLPRHPSQLYESFFEGVILMTLLVWLFWRTDMRKQPGRLAGAGLVWYALTRFSLEWTREPNIGLENVMFGLTMGQALSIPIFIGGVYLLLRPQGAKALSSEPTVA